jgi:hypothetical protein
MSTSDNPSPLAVAARAVLASGLLYATNPSGQRYCRGCGGIVADTGIHEPGCAVMGLRMALQPLAQPNSSIEARHQVKLADRKIRCPSCGYVFEGEEYYEHITYHGEDGPKEDWCPNCEAELIITESVTRTYNVKQHFGLRITSPLLESADHGNNPRARAADSKSRSTDHGLVTTNQAEKQKGCEADEEGK